MQEQQSVVADADAQFDGGEWSGPAHEEIERRLMVEIADLYGLTYDEIETEILRRSCE